MGRGGASGRRRTGASLISAAQAEREEVADTLRQVEGATDELCAHAAELIEARDIALMRRLAPAAVSALSKDGLAQLHREAAAAEERYQEIHGKELERYNSVHGALYRTQSALEDHDHIAEWLTPASGTDRSLDDLRAMVAQVRAGSAKLATALIERREELDRVTDAYQLLKQWFASAGGVIDDEMAARQIQTRFRKRAREVGAVPTLAGLIYGGLEVPEDLPLTELPLRVRTGLAVRMPQDMYTPRSRTLREVHTVGDLKNAVRGGCSFSGRYTTWSPLDEKIIVRYASGHTKPVEWSDVLIDLPALARAAARHAVQAHAEPAR